MGACDSGLYLYFPCLHTMVTRLSAYRQGEKVSAMDEISGELWAVAICGCGVRLGRVREKERTRRAAVFQPEHCSTQRTGVAPRSAVCLLPHYSAIN